MLPTDEVRINLVTVNNIGLGKSIYTREYLEEFARFQDSQGTRTEYLTETAEIAHLGRNEKKGVGVSLGVSSPDVTGGPGGDELLSAQGSGTHDLLPIPFRCREDFG
jgi:hypothetical protein